LKVMVGKPYVPTFRLAARLKEGYGLTIGVLTNNNTMMYDAAFTSGCVDVAVSSHHVHVSKPDPGAYRAMLAGLSDHTGSEVRAESVLFIDDKAKNVDAACELGMHGFLFPSRTKIMDEALADLLEWLRGFGIDVPMDSLTGSEPSAGA
ncbi:MAG: HAD-IA family hydrolase, partial [Planctomycetota bacterium]